MFEMSASTKSELHLSTVEIECHIEGLGVLYWHTRDCFPGKVEFRFKKSIREPINIRVAYFYVRGCPQLGWVANKFLNINLIAGDELRLPYCLVKEFPKARQMDEPPTQASAPSTQAPASAPAPTTCSRCGEINFLAGYGHLGYQQILCIEHAKMLVAENQARESTMLARRWRKKIMSFIATILSLAFLAWRLM